MAAGLAQMKAMEEQDGYTHLEARGAQLEEGVLSILKEKGLGYKWNRVGSMFCLFFTDEVIVNVDNVMKSDMEHFRKFFWKALDAGVYFAPSPYETGFLSVAHTKQDIEQTLEVISNSL